MKKKIFVILSLLLCLAMLVSCRSEGNKTKGEQITELEWEKMRTGDFANFMGESKLNDPIYGESLVLFWVDGDQFRIRMVRNGVLYSQSGQFKIGDELVYCIYDIELGKWVKQAEQREPYGYPYKDARYNFSQFTYDEKRGVYYHTLGVDQGFPEELVGTGETDVAFKFEDGKCIYSRAAQYYIGFDEVGVRELNVSNYGTTVVPIPDLSDIIDAPVTTAPAPVTTSPAK